MDVAGNDGGGRGVADVMAGMVATFSGHAQETERLRADGHAWTATLQPCRGPGVAAGLVYARGKLLQHDVMTAMVKQMKSGLNVHRPTLISVDIQIQERSTTAPCRLRDLDNCQLVLTPEDGLAAKLTSEDGFATKAMAYSLDGNVRTISYEVRVLDGRLQFLMKDYHGLKVRFDLPLKPGRLEGPRPNNWPRAPGTYADSDWEDLVQGHWAGDYSRAGIVSRAETVADIDAPIRFLQVKVKEFCDEFVAPAENPNNESEDAGVIDLSRDDSDNESEDEDMGDC